MKVDWDHLNKKTLPKFWDLLDDKQRRRLICGDSFMSFKSWKQLSEDEQKKIFQIVRDNGDRAFIIAEVKKFISTLRSIR